MTLILRRLKAVSKDGGLCFRKLAVVFFTTTLGLGVSLASADCSSVPIAAMAQLPADLSIWAKLECRDGQHRLVANDGWVWRPVNRTNSNQIELTAGQNGYFRRVSYALMTSTEKKMLIEQYPRFAVPKNLLEKEVALLLATSSQGVEYRFMAITPAEDQIFAYDLNKLPIEEASMIVNVVALKKKMESLKQQIQQQKGDGSR